MIREPAGSYRVGGRLVYDIIGALDGWRQSSERIVLARTVEVHGFGARTTGEALAIAASGATAGSLLAGAANTQLLTEASAILGSARPMTRSVHVRISE
jgi:xanthine/CO dehydrogenase XdhC/CoxF family maturation factor